MATINFARREIEAKVVYCGPALSGKTTNVRQLHRIVPGAQRGDLHVLDTDTDRTLFFDYIPIELGQIAGFTARFKLFTVPGQKMYADTRRVVLQGADAVVFVADSTPDRFEVNRESLSDLEENLKANGLDLRTLPFVLQLNKRDVTGATGAEQLARALNPHGAPVVEAIASEMRGVLDTLYRVTEIAAVRIRENLAGKSAAVRLTTIDLAQRETDDAVVAEHLGRIHGVRGGEQVRGEFLKARDSQQPDDVDQFLLEFVDRETEETAEPCPVVEGAVAEGAEPEAALAAGGGFAVRSSTTRTRPRRVPRPVEVTAPQPTALPALAPRPRQPGEGYARGMGFQAKVHPDSFGGGTIREVLGVEKGPDGDTVIEVVLDRDGVRTRHPMRLVPGDTSPPVEPPNLVPVVVVCLTAGAAVGFLLATWL